MKWDELSTARKIIFIIGCICFFLCFILRLFAAFDLLTISGSAWAPLFGIGWLTLAINQKQKWIAIMYYFFAAAYLLLGLVHFIF